MEVIALDVADLGNQAYLVSDGTLAIAVDVPRSIEIALEALASHSLSLSLVLDTHIHNDFVTGGLALARHTGATYALAADEHVEFEDERLGLHDGDRLTVGGLELEVVATPGHTAHHLSYVVRGADQVAVLTGGSLLVGTTGRTDLLGAERAEELAGAQWLSARRLLAMLPDDAAVHPTHGFGSFCAAGPAGARATTIGRERASNPAALLAQRRFVSDLLAGLGEFPSYYAHMAGLNRAGPAALDLAPVPALGPGEPARVVAAGGWVVDVRPRKSFAAAHLEGAVNAGVDGPLATYVGWVIPWGSALTLLAESPTELETARVLLGQIGIDRISGASIGEPDRWAAPARPVELAVASFARLAEHWHERPTVIDVRRRAEWEAGHLTGAVHIPVHELTGGHRSLGDRGDRGDRGGRRDRGDRPVWLYCAAGYRAVLGASLLARAGVAVVAVDDSWGAAIDAGLPISLPG